MPRAFGAGTMGFAPARPERLAEVEGLHDFREGRRAHAPIPGETEAPVRETSQ